MGGVGARGAAGRARGMSLAKEEVSKRSDGSRWKGKSYSCAAVLSFLCITWSIFCSTFCMIPMIAVCFLWSCVWSVGCFLDCDEMREDEDEDDDLIEVNPLGIRGRCSLI